MKINWRPVGAGTQRDSLHLDGTEVARLHQKCNSPDWYAILDMQRDYRLRLERRCTTREAGVRGCELWAERHAERLQKEIEANRAARGR